jgi:hypothetical protein
MEERKLYAVGCYTAEDWEYIHEILLEDGTLENNIPSESIGCSDLKEHSPTRAVYLLSDEEAEELKNHPKVQFVHLDYASYPEQFKAPPEDLMTDPIQNYRYSESEKQYRNWNDSSLLPATPNATDINRGGYQLLRCVQKEDPWFGLPDTTIIEDRIPYYGDGSDVDVIVGDEGCWIGHAEFQRNTGNGPTNYVGGNVLPGNGTCDLLDLVLDAPYYIDPDWFNADPANRLTTRWDGTIVPLDSVARNWWGDSLQRSATFSAIGTITITSSYTRADCLGSNTARPTISTTHGTQCAANAYGRTQGWAFNANKWVVNAYGTRGSDIEQYFDLMKLFHLYKPVNPTYGTKDPTISSNSWGYRSTSHRSGGTSTDYYYYYKQGQSGGTGVAYRTNTMPGFINYVGLYGDGNRMKGEHLDNSYTTAGKEMIDAGVIFVVASGNSNQKQVGPTHPDFDNYWATNTQGANVNLVNATHTEFSMTAYNTTNRRGFPQQLGKYNDPETGLVIYPSINIGALDDSYMGNGKECKVNYSDMGDEIDCYAPADGTLSAVNAISGKLRPDTYSIGEAIVTDTGFTAIATASARISGTSSFSAVPNTGKKVSTGASSGTVTSITASLLGSASLTSSTPTSPGALTFTGNADDGYWTIPLPFNISFAGSSYNTIYVGTNTYITFGGGSNLYYSLGLTTPAFPKIMISCADNSCQRIYYGTEGSSPNRTFRVRYEGTNSTSGTLGSPNMVYEVIFYENAPTEFDIQIGSNARVSSGPGFSSFYDDKFSGTSSACPVTTGLIATKLQYNRSWTWQDVRNWLKTNVGDANTDEFYTGVESTTANAASWSDVNSLEGGRPIVIWDALTGNEPSYIPNVQRKFAQGSGLRFSGVKISYKS